MANGGQYKFSIGLDDKQLQADARGAAKIFDSLVKQAQEAGVKIDKSFKNPFDELIKNPPQIPPITGAPEATAQFNNLNFATQQLVRELPAASMGLNTLFLALSNNIPIFADQVKNLREQGQSAGSIITQIGKSLFSWQTALTVGITLLTVYGKEVANWIAGLFKGKKALDATKEAQEGLSKAIKENGLGIGDDIVKLRELQNAYKALGDDMNARKRFIIDNKDAFDDLGVSINTVAEADRLLVERTPEFVRAMQLRAQAAAAKKLAEEQYEKAMRIEAGLEEDRKKRDAMSDTAVYTTVAMGDYQGYNNTTVESFNKDKKILSDSIKQRETEVKTINSVADAYFNLAEAKEVEAQSTLKAAEITEPTKDPKTDPKTDPKRTKEIDENLSFFRDADREMERISELLRERIRQQTADWEDYKIKYGTIQEQLLYTTQKYNRLIAEAQTEGERRSLEAERDAILAQFAVEAEGFGKELVDKTTEQLNTMIEELQAQVEAKQAAFNALDNSDSDDAKKYREEINKLKAQIKVLQQQLGKAKKDIGDDNWADATQVFQNISKAANDAAEGIAEFDEGAASVLRTMAQLAGTAINLIGAIQGTMKAFADGVGTIEKASGILAIIGAAIQAVSAIVGAFNSNEEATRNATIALLEYGRALEKISNTELREAFSSIFGDDSYGEFSALLRKTQEQLAELDRIKKELASKNWLGGTGVDYQFAGSYNAQGRLIGRAEKSNIDLVADMRSGWQKFWGSGWDNVAVTDLESFYENGMLNVDKLKAYYDNYKEYLSDEQRDLIEELIHEGQLYAENVAAMNGYLKGLFGDLGQSISDSLLDAFKNGTDAVEAFGEAAGNVIEQLAKDIAHSAFIQPLLNLAEDKIVALRKELDEGNITNEEFLKGVTEITGNLIAGVADVQDEVNALYQYVDESAAANGIESAFDSERSGTAKGVAQASQDSVDELNGRATAIQMHTSSIMTGVQQLTKDSAQALKHLAGIESNTAELRQMRLDLNRVATSVDDMATRGVKMI